jgi:serine protease Do
LNLLLVLLLLAPVSRPTVYRVTAFDTARTQSMGTGTCVATANHQSLILTARHVIQDGHGFKVGEYPAKVVAQNKTWDLAALVVDEVLPVTVIGHSKPVMGQPLTICGYGSGDYREATGVVSQFVQPDGKSPADIVAINVAARSGDSGGPMLDAEGRLAGVLFGSDKLGAHGSHCIRVRWFIESIEGYALLKREALNPMVLYGR